MDNRSMFYGASPRVFRKAFMLRGNETKAERLLWERLSGNQIRGFRFKRQHPIANYVADFYCHKAKLVIEIDEDYHNNPQQQQKDEIRMNVMNELGLRVLRFSDTEVFQNIDLVIEEIVNCLSLR